MIRIICFALLLLTTTLCQSSTLMIVGDSLSAGYQMPIEKAWPSLLSQTMKERGHDITVVNASISGDTSGNAKDRLQQALETHQPDWVLLAIGGNDGLRGFPPTVLKNNLIAMIEMIRAANAQPIVMHIRIPLNYGKRYTAQFSSVYSGVANHTKAPLMDFFPERIFTDEQWLMDDNLHPNPSAQPIMADHAAQALSKLMNIPSVSNTSHTP